MMRRIFFFFLFLTGFAMFAQSESAIHGTILDTKKLILPGASVSLKRAGGSSELTAYTDAEGKFDFSNLSKGSYEIRAELDGFQTVTAEVALEDSTVRTIQITLPEAQKIQESVTVSANDSETLAKEETQHKEEIDEQVLDRAPIANQRFQDALPLIPSVIRGPDGLMNINGARASESALLVNGSNVTDPVTGNFAIELPIEAVENVEVFTDPYSAEFGKFSGGVTSVSTKSGQEHFKFEVNDFLPRFHFDDGINGVEAFTPRVRVSGPAFIRNLFFSQAVQYKLNRTFLDDLPKDANMIQLEGFDSITQFDYRPSSTHQMSFTLSAFPEKEKNVLLNTFLPEKSTPDFKQNGYNIGLFDRRFFANGSFLENSFSYKTYDVSVLPKGDLANPFEVTIDGDRGSYFNFQDRDSSRLQWTGAYTFRPSSLAGPHSVRAGIDFAYTSYSGVVHYSPVEVLGQDGRLLERVDFAGDGNLGHSSNEISAYVQDHWAPLDGVTVDSGLRMDFDSISNTANLGPRISMAYAPASLPKTVFKAGFGIFYDKIFLNTADFEDYPSRTISEYNDEGDLIATKQLVNQVAGDIKAPRSVTWNLEVDHQIASKILLRSNFLGRQGSNQFLITPTDGQLLLINSGHSRYWGWELTAKYGLSDDSSIYASYIRSSTKGDSNDFDSYFGNFQSPLIRDDAYSVLPFDAPNRFLFWGVVQIPGKIYLSPLLEIHDGFPYSVIDQAQQFVGARNSERFPAFHQLDLRVTRTFKILDKYNLTAGVKVFNILNQFNPRDVQNNIESPAFGTFYNGVGRIYRMAFEIQY